MKKLFKRVIAVVCAISIMSTYYCCTFAEENSDTLYAQAEIHVDRNRKLVNFKSADTLTVGGGKYAYISFDISSFDLDTIYGARLKMTRTDSEAFTLNLYKTDSFTENIKFNSKPDVPAISTNGDVDAEPVMSIYSSKEQMNIDVRALIAEELRNGSTALNLMMYTDSSEKYIIKSRENSQYDPEERLRLEIDTTDDENLIKIIEDINLINFDGIDELSQLQLPDSGEIHNSQFSWESSNNAVLDADTGEINRPTYFEEDVSVVLKLHATLDTTEYIKEYTVLIKKGILTNEERIEYDFENTVSYLNESLVTENIAFPVIGEYGTSFVYESANENVVKNDGTITRGEESVDVDINVFASYEGIEIKYTITVTVVKNPASNIGVMNRSFEDVYQYVKNYIENSTTGTNPGNFSEALKETSLIKLDEAYYNAEATYEGYKTAAELFETILTEYMDSAVICDDPDLESDRTDDQRIFSQYRLELMKYVAKSEIALLTEPNMYTESTKYAFQNTVDYAKSVLDGSYKRPFTRNRFFVEPLMDQHIQFALNHETMAWACWGKNDGIIQMLAWYKAQHIMRGTTKTVTLLPSDDTIINSKSENSNYASDTTLNLNTTSIGFLKFDLSQLEGNILDAELKMYNSTKNVTSIYMYHLDNDDWNENTLTYKSWLQANGGECYINTDAFISAQRASANSSISYDVTEYAAKNQAADGFLSLQAKRADYKYTMSFPTKESSVDIEQKIRLIVETDVVDRELLEEKYDMIVGKADDVLEKATPGSDVGNYPQEVIDDLNEKRAALIAKNEEGDTIPTLLAMVDMYNSLYNARKKQVFRQDIEMLSNAFFSEQDMLELPTKIKKYPFFTDIYTSAKENADNLSLVDAKKKLELCLDEDTPINDRINETNKLFKNTTSTRSRSFTPPADTAYGIFEIWLDPEDNEENENNFGHVWVDTVKITPTSYEALDLADSGFEQDVLGGKYWEKVVYSGEPIVKLEDRANYVPSGSYSCYIENPTANDCGGVRYKEKLKLVPGVSHAITVLTKIDRRLKGGVCFKVTYYNSNNQEIRSDSFSDTKVAAIADMGEVAQECAIVYMVDKKEIYAEKAKVCLMQSINDFCQGAESWLLGYSRPFGIDAYGQVQGGRRLQAYATTYALIKDSGVISEEEDEQILAGIEYIMDFCVSLRDADEVSVADSGKGGNWMADQACGATLAGLTFTGIGEVKARQYANNAMRILLSQITLLPETGAWPESLRYANTAVDRYCIAAHAANVSKKDNWYEDTRLVKLIEYLCNVRSPYNEYSGKITQPGFGDTSISEDVFYNMGIVWKEISEVNPKLGQWAYENWVDAGKKVNGISKEASGLKNFFNHVDYDLTENYQMRLHDYQAENVGLYMFRENFKRDNDKLLVVMSNDSQLKHGHLDNGSIGLWANSTPLIIDPGIGEYMTASTSYFTGSSSHSTMLFANSSGTYPNNASASTREVVHTSDELNYMVVDFGNDCGRSERNIIMLENGFNALIVWDRTYDVSHSTLFNLGVSAHASSISGNVVLSSGFFDTDLKTTVLEPQNPTIETHFEVTSVNAAPKVDGYNKLNYVEISGGKNDNHLTLIEPLKKGQSGVKTETIATGIDGVTAYKLIKSDGKYAVLIANSSDSDKTVSLTCEDRLVNMITKEDVIPRNGKISVLASGRRVTVLSNTADPVADKIEVTGYESIGVPTANYNTGTYDYNVISQYDNTLFGKEVSWSVEGDTEDVTISHDGILKVGKDAKVGGKVTIVASFDDVRGERTVRLQESTSRIGSVEITAPDKVFVQDNGSYSHIALSANVLDQFGKVMEDEDVVWSVVGCDAYMNANILYVPSSAKVGESLTVIARSKNSVQAVSTHSITVTDKNIGFLNVRGNRTIAKPKTGNLQYSYDADVIGLNGDTSSEYSAVFTLADNTEGVSITEDGLLTISDSAESGTNFNIIVACAEDAEITDVVTVYIADSIPERIVLSGDSEIDVPNKTVKQFKYTSRVYDNNGEEISCNVTYKIKGDAKSAVINGGNGTLSVYSTTPEQKITIRAVVENFDNVYDEIEVTIHSDKTETLKPSDSLAGGGSSGGGGGGGASGSDISGGGPSGGDTSGGDATDPNGKDETVFNDVDKTHWAYSDILQLKKDNIISGSDDGNFYPEENITRAEFTKIIVNAMGFKKAESNVFIDVNEDDWFYDYVTCAFDKGIIKGETENEFKPYNNITREQILSILYRVYLLNGNDKNETGNNSEFTDKDEISDYAKAAVETMTKIGIVGGYEDGSLKPFGFATRAEAARMINKFLNANTERMK